MSGVISAQSEHRLQAEGQASIVPAIGPRLAMPPEFGRRFVIFADAEEEFDWHQPLARDNVSTTAITHLVEATARFNASGVYPSYLVDYPVVNNPESAAIIRSLVESGAADVGTQLHPWVTPPFEEEVSEFNSFTGNLPVELQRAKLAVLTAKIAESTGVRPTTYRAGRYGLGPNTMDLLTEAGYRMDVSVRPCFNYSDRMGADYRQHPLWPWRVNDQLIELPLTTGWTGALNTYPALFQKRWLRGTLARTGMLSRIPLTPEGVPLADALEAITILYDNGLEVFSLSFHTPSVVVGHTPYVRCEKELALFWAWWDGVFNAFAKLGVTPVRQDEIIAAADSAR
jgi:hypothetical protein